jgi:hypothetical protein
MRRSIVTAVLAVVLTTVAAVSFAQPASANTVGVPVRVYSSVWCPSGWTAYVRSIDVSLNPNRPTGAVSGSWIGYSTTPTVTVNVSSGGASAQVVVGFSCQGSWPWQQTTPAPIYGTRWAYGSGYQPTWNF